MPKSLVPAQAWTRRLIPLATVTTVLAGALAIGITPAHADAAAPWLRCGKDRPITVTFAPAGRTPGITPAAERKLVAAAFADVSEMTGGRVTFTFVPTTRPRIDWSDEETVASGSIPFTANPPVDAYVLMMPDGRPTPPSTTPRFNFRNDRPGAWSVVTDQEVGLAEPVAFLTHSYFLLDGATAGDLTRERRLELYRWAAVNTLTDASKIRPSAALSSQTRALVRDAARAACSAVRTFPDAGTGGT